MTSRNQGGYGRSYSRNSGEEERGPWKRGCDRRSLNVSLTEFGKKYLNQFLACERIMDLSLTYVLRLVLATLLFSCAIPKSGNVYRVQIREILVLFAI